MFEKILQKILKQAIGQFTEQIDTNQLSIGIWSGQIQIAKLKLKAHIFKKFGLPIKIYHSQLKGFKMIIPWKSLFSSPLIVQIQSAVILCQLDDALLSQQQRSSLIVSFIQSTIKDVGKNIMQKMKVQDEKQDGYLDGVLLKMLDNLYLSIKNIHFRFQNQTKKFSFGLSLQALQIFAVNQNNQKIFIDRTKLKEQQKVIRRKINVSNFGLYWNCQQTKFFANTSLNTEQISDLLLKTMYKNSNKKEEGLLLLNKYIFAIAIEGTILQDHSKSIQKYSIQFYQQKFKLKLQKKMINQMFFLAEQFSLINQRYLVKNQTTLTAQLQKQLKEYCTSFLADSKGRKVFSPTSLGELISMDFQNLRQKIQQIILIDIGKDLIAKSFTLKEADLKKVMMNISKNQVKKQLKPEVQLSFNIPQIQLFIVNQLSMPIFQIQAKNFKFKCQVQQKCTVLVFALEKLEMFGNQRCYIIWSGTKQNKKFIQGSIISTESLSKVNFQISFFSCLYDSVTMQQLAQLIKFEQIDSRLKNKAFDKLEQLQQSVGNKMQSKKSQIQVQILSKGFQILINQRQCTWILKTNFIQLNQKLKEQKFKALIKGLSLQCNVGDKQINKQQFQVIQPFELQIIQSLTQNKSQIKSGSISLNINKKLYIEILNLEKNLFKSKKRQIVQKSTKIGEVFLKQNRWKKTIATIYNGKLYLWDNQNEFPIGYVRIRIIYQKITDNMTSLCISDKKKLYEIAFSKQSQFKQWKKQFQKIVQIHNSEELRQKSRQQSERLSKKSQKSQQKKEAILELFIKSITMNAKLSAQDQNQVVKVQLYQIGVTHKSYEANDPDRLVDETRLKLQNIQIWYENCRMLQKKQKQPPLVIVQIKNYQQQCDVQSQISTQIVSCRFVFNPIMIIRIQGFLHLQDQQKNFEKTDQQALSKQNQNKILRKIKFKIDSLQMVTIHKKSKLKFCQFQLNQIKLQIDIKYYQICIEGFGQQLQLSDLTNYPNTLFTANDKVQIVKRPVISSAKNNNIIQFNYKMIRQGSPKFGLKNQTLNLKFIHIQINYYHEIIARIIDYFFVQLIGSITTPQFFDQFLILKRNNNQNYQAIDFSKFIKKRNEILKTKMMVKFGKQKLQYQILHNQPMFLNIQFFDTILNLPILNSKESVYCQIKNIQISNDKLLEVKQINQRQLSFCYLTYNIVLDMACFQCFQDQKITCLSSESTKIVIKIKLFNKDLQYNFIYGQNIGFKSSLDLDVQIQPLEIVFNLHSLNCLNRFLALNIQHEDGLQFMMIYDYIQLVPPMLINLELSVQTFSLEFAYQNESMILQAGYFKVQFLRTHQYKKTSLSSQYIIVNFGQEGDYQQILTSRKNFKLVSPRKSFFRSLITTNKLINNANDNIIKIEMNTDLGKKQMTTVIQTQELMLLLNINFVFFLKKVQLYKKQIEPIPKTYLQKQQKEAIVSNIEQQYKNQLKIKLEKILFCYQISQKQGIFLSLLFNCNYIQDQNSIRLVFPHIQGFISDEEQVSCQNIHQMKKRTILRPTQLKYSKTRQTSQFSLDRSFFKFSVNDIKEFSLLKAQLNKKMKEFDKLSEQVKNKSLKQISLYSNKSNRESIKSMRQSIRLTQKIDIKTIQIMIVNDCNDLLLPLMYLNTNFQFESGFNNFKFIFYSDFFNIRNSTWEPLIQLNQYIISLNPQLSIKASNPKEYININISTNFIQNLYKSFNSTQLKVSKFFDNQLIDKDQINSWIVINQMGQTILCKPCEDPIQKKHINENQKKQTQKQSQPCQSVRIKQHQKQKINFFVNYHQNFNQSKQGEVLVNIVVEDKLQIKKINLNQMGLKKIKFMYRGKKCVIFKNLFTDISKNVKYVTFSSPICIENRADKAIKLKHIKIKNYLIIDPLKKIFLPFDYDLQQVSLASNDAIQQKISQDESQFLLNTQLQEKNNYLKLSNLSQDSQIKIVDGLSFNITTVFQKTKRKIVFQPLYKLKNYLPLQLVIVFKQKQSSNMKTQIILQERSSQQNDNNNQQFFYYCIQNCQFSMYVEGYQWSQFVQFEQDIYYLKNYQGEAIEIRINKNYQKGKISQIEFYTSYTLKNQCQKQLQIYDNQKRKVPNKILKKQQICLLHSRYNIIGFQGKKSHLLYIKNQNQFEVEDSKRNSYDLRSFSSFCILRQYTKIHQNLLINQFKIHPMYLFKNQSSYSVLLRSQKSKPNEVQKINSNTSQNIHFYSSVEQKIKRFVFELCLTDQEYQWSSPLNFKVQKRSCFVLRSRFDYRKVKYFRIKIQKAHKFCYQISFKEQVQDQIPYLLINQCQNYNIFVHNFHIQLKTGKQTFFSWDDPFNNQQNIQLSFQNLRLKDLSKKSQNILMHNIKASTNQSFKILFKNQKNDVLVEIVNQMNRKTCIFLEQDKNIQKSQEQLSNSQLDLPLRVSIINNSVSPAVHLIDLSSQFKIQLKTMTSSKILSAQLNLIQIDNQAQFNAYFPVVLSTSFKMIAKLQKQSIVQFQSDVIFIKIEEDFIKEMFVLIQFFQNLTNQYSKSQISKNKKKEEVVSEGSSFFISKVKFPKITIDLQIQTKKFSIETVLNLQKPAITTYPWKQFPYPIKKIAINVLSHLSISPWSFISSFKKGVQILLTEQQTGRAFEGFFGSVIGALSNSINGLVGMIVGHDIERVNTFTQGIQKGVSIFFTSLSQIPDFQGCHNLTTFVQSTGKTLINLVFKPIKGVLRLTLKITQGIKKTTKFSFDQKTQIKTRLPIVFYNRKQYFTKYNVQESKLLQQFKKLTYNKISYFYYVVFFKIDCKMQKQELLVVLGTQQIILLSKKYQKMLWNLQINKIQSLHIVDVCKVVIIYGQQIKDKVKNEIKYEDKNNIQFEQLPQGSQIHQIMMMNQKQANSFLQTYMKLKQNTLVEFNN